MKQLLHTKPIKALFTTVLLLLIIGGGKVVILNTDAFNPLSAALEQFHFSDIYFQWHRGHNADAETDILLIDIANLRGREEIATLIDSINAHNPRVIAIDIIFPSLAENDPAADSHLVATIKACKNVVLAKNFILLPDGDNYFEQSFFANDSTNQGLVNINAETVRSVPATLFGMKTFSATVAEVSGKQTYSDGEPPLIDFGCDNIMRWQPLTEDMDMNYIEGKIVFLGDMYDLRDWHNIPVTINGQRRMSGTEIHAHATIAFVSERPYHAFPRFWGVVLQIILLYLFCWLLYLLPQTLDNWVQGFLQIVFILLMMPTCHLLFVCLHVICSPTIAIIGFSLAGLAKNIVDSIIKTKKDEK